MNETNGRGHGSIKRMVVHKGFGFLLTDEGTELFFHRSELFGGLLFPTTVCTCGHQTGEHAKDNRMPEGFGVCLAPSCRDCAGYVRRPSPAAVYPGQRVTYALTNDEKGRLRAVGLLPEVGR